MSNAKCQLNRWWSLVGRMNGKTSKWAFVATEKYESINKLTGAQSSVRGLSLQQWAHALATPCRVQLKARIGAGAAFSDSFRINLLIKMLGRDMGIAASIWIHSIIIYSVLPILIKYYHSSTDFDAMRNNGMPATSDKKVEWMKHSFRRDTPMDRRN